MILTEQTKEDLLRQSGYTETTISDFASPQSTHCYCKVGAKVYKREKKDASDTCSDCATIQNYTPPQNNNNNTPNNTVDANFKCIDNALKDHAVKLFNSPSNAPVKYVKENLSDVYEGETTQILYYADNKVEFRTYDTNKVLSVGSWSCMNNDTYRICWNGKCEPFYVGRRRSGVGDDKSCCTGGGSGSQGTSGTSGTSGGSNNDATCPNGYKTTCYTKDEIKNSRSKRKKALTVCTNCDLVKEIQDIPALTNIIYAIQDRLGKTRGTDTYFGPVMLEAVKTLQASRGITATGNVGKVTLASLEQDPGTLDPKYTTQGTSGSAGTSGSSGTSGTSGTGTQPPINYRKSNTWNPNDDM